MRQAIPQPGFVEQDVHDLLATGQFMLGDTYTITPISGDPLYYTSYQQDVNVLPVYEAVVRRTFLCRKVNITGLKMIASVGIQVDEQEISVGYSPDPLAYQNRMSWPQAIMRGMLDGARIRRDQYIRADGNSPWIGGWTMFSGLVSGINSVGRSSATIRVKSDLILLDTQMPRDFYEPNCKNTWGDPACGIDQLDFMTIGAIEAGSTRTVLNWAGADPGFALGKVHISSGDDTVRVRTISNATDTQLFLAYPLDFEPAEGQLFEAYLGCDRTAERCQFFHGDPVWKTRFKGFPFIPVAETAVGVGVGGTESKGGK